MLAGLYNDIVDDQSLQHFSFINADQHTQIIDAIARKYNVALPVYILDPISTNNPANWLYTHQAAHNDMNAILGIAGNDLTDVDFKNKEQVASWVWLHAQEHYQASNKLGIG